ncbi:MAG: lysophospholipid acyltransferase family protein [Pseudomonadota bacterium]
MVSYLEPHHRWLKRLVVRGIEIATGQPRIQGLYHRYRHLVGIEGTFWDVALRYLDIDLDFEQDKLSAIPRDGSVVVVANHPFGIVDGIAICQIVGRVRDDFKILTNAALYRAPEAREHLLPVDFSGSKAATATNVQTRALARKHIENGGVIVVFPAGGVSTVEKPLSKHAIDAEWQPFVADLVMRAAAPVVPIYFAGQNSRLFQLASHIHETLRLSLFLNEVANKIGSTLYVQIGELLPFDLLAAQGDKRSMTQFLRERTYALAPS